MPLLLERAKKYCPERSEAILGFLGCELAELISSVRKLADISISATEAEIAQVAARWKNGVKNFDRSPGGFSYKDAEKALISLIS